MKEKTILMKPLNEERAPFVKKKKGLSFEEKDGTVQVHPTAID